MIQIKQKKTLLFLIFFCLALIHILISAPGNMSGDSYAVYNEALKHQYSDHHPPLMAFMWHYLNYIYAGPLLMYLFNMILLWSSTYLLAFNFFKTKGYQYLIMLIPFTPWVWIYSSWIWKDIIFTFGYGLLTIILSLKHYNKKVFSTLGFCSFILGLIYFTSVKFQAKFILPIILFWFLKIQFKQKFIFNVLITIVTTLLILQIISFTNGYLVNNKGQGSNYSWQYVKIYDLAGISVELDKVVVPKFLLSRSDITIKDIKDNYSLAWEGLVVNPDSPINKTKSDQERILLLKAWQQEVINHPFAYLKHRAKIWFKGLLLPSPLKGWLVDHTENKTILKYLSPIATLGAFIFLMPIFIFSFIISIKYLKKEPQNKFATPLLYILLMGITLLFILLFFSLAMVPRYIYFSCYFFILAIPFTLACISQKC